MRTLNCIALTILQLASVSCVTDVEEASIGSNSNPTADDEALTVVGSREVTVATSANARCDLTSVGTGTTMPVWADDSGIVHLWTNLTAPGGDLNSYTLACDEPAGKTKYDIDLGNDATFKSAMPKVAPTSKRSVLQPLSNPETADAAALTRAGYPPRPHKESSLYPVWLSIVSRPMTRITAPIVERPDLKFGPVFFNSSPQWAALVLNAPSTRYSLAAATFTIPVQTIHLGTPTNAAFWAGLGGVNLFDEIIQAGTSFTSGGFLAHYDAWLEFVPAPAGTVPITVAPGNSVYVAVWEGDASCNFGFVTGFACYYWANLTTGQFIMTSFEDVAGHFAGNSCEGAVERQIDPGNNGLAKWTGSKQMTVDCWDIAGGYHNFDSDQYLNTLMVSGTNATLAQASQQSSNVLNLTWVRER